MSALRLPPVLGGADAARALADAADGGAIAIATPSAVPWLEALEHPFERILVARSATQDVALELHDSLQGLGERGVVAVGGGKALDVAKLASRAVYVEGRWQAASSIRPLLAVPTTCGSGSESTSIAVVVAEGCKRPSRFECLRPDAIALFPERLTGLAARPRIAGFFDALTHLVEGATSPLADATLVAVAASVLARFLDLVTRGEWASEDLASALWLSAFAGAVQDASSVGLVHGLSHALEVRTGLGHGELNAGLLVPVLRFNREKSPKWDALCLTAGLDPEAAFRMIEESAARYGFSPPSFDPDPGFCQEVARDTCTRTNCRLVRPSDIPAILGRGA